jgi:VanZ family protein
MIVCLLPKEHIPPAHFAFEDLVVHMTCYGILAVLLIYGLKDCGDFLEHNVLKIFITMVCYGILIEILQEVLPVHRTLSWEDMLMNSMGSGVVFFYKRILKGFLI